jgi:hypothetical protein
VARAALDAQSVPDELTCSISFELLLHAVSIPCGHTFSRKGLDDHVKTAEFEGKELTCPTCRAVFDKNATFRNWIVESMARRFAE